MSRKKHAIDRPVRPDVHHGSELVARFTNYVMKDGKKAVAQRIVNDALTIIGEKNKDAPSLEVFEKAIENVKPVVEVKSRRVGGANYQVPVEVRPARRQALAFRWIIGFANKRSEYLASQRLANELLDAFNGTGGAMRKREETHKMADANKAFAHYRY
jgi:small subunit ribosomal protein S7